jgi:hypothetical protein
VYCVNTLKTWAAVRCHNAAALSLRVAVDGLVAHLRRVRAAQAEAAGDGAVAEGGESEEEQAVEEESEAERGKRIAAQWTTNVHSHALTLPPTPFPPPSPPPTTLMSQPQLHRTVSDNITVR